MKLEAAFLVDAVRTPRGIGKPGKGALSHLHPQHLAATVLTGDYLFARAAELAAETDSVRVMRVFARTLMIIVNGEINQLFIGRGQASRQDYDQRIYAKTASLFAVAEALSKVASGAGSGVPGSAKRLVIG